MIEEIPNVYDIESCQSLCNIIYHEKCTDFLFSVKDKTCQLYMYTVLDSGLCSNMGGDGGENATDIMECLPFFGYKSNSCAVSKIYIMALQFLLLVSIETMLYTEFLIFSLSAGFPRNRL